MPPTRQPRPKVSLARVETGSSRFLLIKPDAVQRALLESASIMPFGLDTRERHFWSQLLTGDLVVGLSFTAGEILAQAYRIATKGFLRVDAAVGPSSPPLLVHCELLGEGHLASLKGSAFFIQEHSPFVARESFRELFEECDIVPTRQLKRLSTEWKAQQGRFNIRLATTAIDFAKIVSMAKSHPFGLREALVSLVAEDSDGKIVGAILLSPATDTHAAHTAAWRVFRHEYPRLRAQAVDILRIYSDERCTHRWQLHRELVEAAISSAPSLVPAPLAFIEGVSYDYHPVGPAAGFNVEAPRAAHGSFYYWKPYAVPAWIAAPDTKRQRLANVKAVLRDRRAIQYWVVPGRSEHIPLARRKNAWAVRRRNPTTGFWRCLRPGHVVFVMDSETKVVVAAGTVSGTQSRIVRGWEDFPLWIDFEASLGDVAINIAEHVREPWFEQAAHGGLIPLPDEFGAHLKTIADSQISEGRMWVYPNPLLLHQTEFSVKRGQIFIVQSWSLTDSVLPSIREILSRAGYSVIFSGDREGQIVFETVWLMLNESEAVIVDFTGKRPNVYLEYGMALVLGKPIVAITQDPDDIPSDTPNLKYIHYKNEMNSQSLARLPKAISDIVGDVQRIRQHKGTRQA